MIILLIVIFRDSHGGKKGLDRVSCILAKYKGVV